VSQRNRQLKTAIKELEQLKESRINDGGGRRTPDRIIDVHRLKVTIPTGAKWAIAGFN